MGLKKKKSSLHAHDPVLASDMPVRSSRLGRVFTSPYLVCQLTQP